MTRSFLSSGMTTRKGVPPFSLPHYLSPEHLSPWGEEAVTLLWWTHLTSSPTWKTSQWVNVIGNISSRIKSLWDSPNEGRAKAKGDSKGQGWEYSSPRPPSHSAWAHNRCCTCTMCDINWLQGVWLALGILLWLHPEAWKTQYFPSTVVPEQPRLAEMSGPYQGKRSPTEECRKTRRHSVWCRGCRRCSQEPSTSQGGRSAGKKAGNEPQCTHRWSAAAEAERGSLWAPNNLY